MRLLEALRRLFTGYAAAATVVFCASGGLAQELTAEGVQLPSLVLSDVVMGGVEKTIAVNGANVEATHVVVQIPGAPPLMRDRQGVFLPWDIDPAHLADTGFPADGGRVNFKVFSQDLSAHNFPIRVTLYYRTGGALKFGYFDVLRAK